MKKGQNVEVGSVIVVDVVNDNNVVIEEQYQIEQFYPSFILCRCIRGGYRETFSPHELYKMGLVSWNQRIHYNHQTGFACEG